MTELNLTKDPIMLLLLQNIVRGASKISVQDKALNQKVAELKQFMQSPTSVPYELVSGSMDKLAELLHGYELPKDTGEDPTVKNQIGSLPASLYQFKIRLEELKTETELNTKHFSTAEIEIILDRYVKLATKE